MQAFGLNFLFLCDLYLLLQYSLLEVGFLSGAQTLDPSVRMDVSIPLHILYMSNLIHC